MASSAEGIRWNLTDLFSAADDPQIENTLADCHARAQAFAKRMRPLMQDPHTLGAEDLHGTLIELESIYEALGRVESYAGLLYAADTANPVHQDLEQKIEQRSTEVRNLVLFFELEG
jgi:oligoendopeptidase F